MEPGTRRLLVRIVAAILLALAPVVALSLSPWHAATGLLVLGILPTLTAVPSGRRAMLTAGAASTVIAALAVLASATGPLLPAVGTSIVVVLAFFTGSLSPRGLHPIGAATISFTAYVLVDPSLVLSVLDAVATVPAVAGLVAAAVLVTCAWVLLIARLLLRGVTLPVPAQPATLPYGLLLAVLCGAFALVCLVWFRGTNAWWAVMTVALILQPTGADTREKLGGRIVGTVVGGTVAALVAGLLPGTAAATLLGVAATLASVFLLLGGTAYWLYTAAVTVSVVLLTFDADTALAGDVQRVVITLIAAAVTAAVTWAVSRLAPLPDD
ncbi:FUSC family protein [Microbacterium luticocti]|uniref:FUSC family protein n=1 Tax=Microbacterium luticocti TaxID=451764 RepID=UPI000405D500|nr:FUSC family protein [Microbacterium luticocti]